MNKIVYNSYKAVCDALEILKLRESDHAIRLGNKVLGRAANRETLLFNQISQSSDLVSALGVLNYTLGKDFISTKQMVLICFAPVLLDHAQKNFKNFSTKIEVIGSYWGPLCHTAQVVTMVVLFRLGNQIYPAVFLAVLGFGYLRKNIHRPLLSKIEKWYLPILKLILSPSVIFQERNFFSKVGAVFQFGFALEEVVSLAHRLFLTGFSHYKDEPDSHLLTFNHFLKIIGVDQNFNPVNCSIEVPHYKVNRKHVFVIPFPMIPDPLSHFSSIEEEWNKLTWEGDEILSKINYCNREIEFQESGQTPKIYAKKLLDELIDSIKDQTIETGAPLDYSLLQNQLAFIAEELTKRDDSVKKSILLWLALEGGDVCGPGIYGHVGTAAQTLLNSSQGVSNNLPLKQRVLITLLSLRVGIFDEAYQAHQSCCEKYPIFMGGGPVGESHNKNLFYNVFATHFGIPDEGALSDPVGQMELMGKKIGWFVANYFQKNPFLKCTSEQFWMDGWRLRLKKIKDAPSVKEFSPYKGYTPCSICDAVRDAMGGQHILKTDIYNWARSLCPPNKKEAFEEALIQNHLLEESFGDGDYVLRDSVLEAMLIDMGILEIL